MDNIETYNREEETVWMSPTPSFRLLSSISCSSIRCTEQSKRCASLVEGKWAGSGKKILDQES